ncbi:serine protease [Desertihabitans brevis]|uniref:Serine protease n=1 Tax=Desertihabitans brevis TaxID=2268447 RepID=A0A367YUB0_9ACTN|nr:S1 family peptidase [Desertihabitans brevis]RCK69347.1 serine protease [Desertihabitans brevis]
MEPTPTPRRRRRLGLGLLAGAATLALATSLTPAAAEPDATAAEEALAASEGISVAEAREQFQHEAELSRTSEEVVADLGEQEQAGSYIEGEQLVVAVTSEAAAEKVRAGGAEARVVQRSQAELDETMSAVEAAAAPGLVSWGVDPKANRVVVEVAADADDAATQRAVAEAEAAGAEVVEVEGRTETTVGMVGGEQYEFRADGGTYVCSVGFTATDASGRPAMVSAGHCAEGASNFTFKGTAMGTPIGVSFPGDDHTAFALAAGVTPSAAVSTYDGSATPVAGSREAAVGAAICKSGRTTAWTCGTIQRKNVTVNYGGTDTVGGLTQHSACTEGGDSGGANVSGQQAQAVTSGGRLYGTSGVCGEKVGQPTVSFSQPVNEILTAYDLDLLTS